MHRLSAALVLVLVGCQTKPSIDVLTIINQPQSYIEQKFGKSIGLSSDNQLQAFPQPNGVSSLYILFSPDGRATRVIIEFPTASGTSLEALERVGLGENGISRAADIREESG